MAEKINKEELSLMKHTKSLLKSTKFHCDAYVVATSECGYMPFVSLFVTLRIKTAMPK